MKQITKSVVDFILAFDLLDPIKGVCFDATAYCYTDKLVLKVECEIHIITILEKKIDVLYFLNPALIQQGFPDMFESEHYDINFKNKKGLLIKSTGEEQINYTILIQPSGKDCELVTLQDICGKIYN